MSQQRNKTAEYRAELFESATEIIDHEYADQLSLGSVAHRIATSDRQLQRAFNEVGHTTFSDHLVMVRMKRAASLLSDSNLKVTEVANLVGYRHPNYFSKIFRRYLGTAPTKYRRLNGRADGIRCPQNWR